MKNADVVVIGGSLAGSAAAFALARRGLDVVVLEKSRFPRPKICGEYLSSEAHPVLVRMGVLEDIRARGAETISSFSAVRADGKGVTAPLPEPVLSVSRELLDEAVARRAAEAGAEIRFEETVTAISGSLPSGFETRSSRGKYRSRVVIGAWGRYSPLDGKLGRSFFRKEPTLFGFKKHLEGESGFLKDRVILHLFPGGYLGLSRVEGGVVNLASLTVPGIAKEAHHDFERLLRRLEDANPVLAADLRGLRPKPGPVLLSEPVHLGPRDPVALDVLLAGDAAGVLDPYTGAGMSAALVTGEAVAGPVSEFLAGRVSARLLQEVYRKKYAGIMRGRFFFSRLFRPAFVSEWASQILLPAGAPLARLAVRLTRVKPA